MKKTVKFKIGGIYYIIKSEKSEDEIMKTARFFSDKVDEAAAGSNGDKVMAAILAGLIVSDELFAQKAVNSGLKEQTLKYSDEIDRLRTENYKLKTNKTKGD